MSRKFTRTRKSDRVRETTTPESRQDPPAPIQQAPETEARASSEPRTSIDMDDLLALAQMDPAELAALMSDSVQLPRFEVGTRVKGTITRVGREDLFVDLGGKAEGTLDRAELPEASPGDEVEAFVLAMEEGSVRLSTRLSGSAAAGYLDEARESGIPVDGRVVSRNSGGFEVRVGSVRAFCPISRISRLPEVDLDAYVGQVLQFRVVESGDKVVLDRRVLQEEENAARAEALWQSLAQGDKLRGTVRNVQPFGVFVDVGGVDGLVPRSELGWGGTDPSRYSAGQSLEVEVLEIDREARRLTLSARHAEDDPWLLVGNSFRMGGIYEGEVVRVEPYGAFVALTEGLVGLVHNSRLPSGLPKVGESLQVRLVSVDDGRRRLELAPATADEQAEAGAQVKGTVTQVLKNGIVVLLPDGRTGWLAAREVELPAGTVLAQRFRVGKPVTARVLEEQGDRVSLTLREEPSQSDDWRVHARGSGRSEGFGTLGDLLGKLDLRR